MKPLEYLKIVFGGLALLLFLGFGIDTEATMPAYAVVYLDGTSKTFIPYPCIEEWRTRPTSTVDFVTRGTAGEAFLLKYNPDQKCSYLMHGDGESISRLFLIRLGLMSPIRHWWDAPYRTEDGQVTPGQK
jgi:hypothetical protein